MKTTGCALLVSALVAWNAGCDRGTLGGPKAPTGGDNKAPVVTSPNEGTFSVDVPNLATKLSQGESKNVTIALRRGKNFDQEVKLSFENLPTGTTIEPSHPIVKSGETDAKITIHAGADAAVGDHDITVKGQPATGAAATNHFTVTVKQK